MMDSGEFQVDELVSSPSKVLFNLKLALFQFVSGKGLCVFFESFQSATFVQTSGTSDMAKVSIISNKGSPRFRTLFFNGQEQLR